MAKRDYEDRAGVPASGRLLKATRLPIEPIAPPQVAQHTHRARETFKPMLVNPCACGRADKLTDVCRLCFWEAP